MGPPRAADTSRGKNSFRPQSRVTWAALTVILGVGTLMWQLSLPDCGLHPGQENSVKMLLTIQRHPITALASECRDDVWCTASFIPVIGRGKIEQATSPGKRSVTCVRKVFSKWRFIVLTCVHYISVNRPNIVEQDDSQLTLLGTWVPGCCVSQEHPNLFALEIQICMEQARLKQWSSACGSRPGPYSRHLHYDSQQLQIYNYGLFVESFYGWESYEEMY